MADSTRRELIGQASLAAGLTALGGVWSSRSIAQSKSPNEKLNIGCIGIGGQGASDVGNVSSQNIVALCDVDAERGGLNFERYSQAKRYTDFRKLLEQKDIDAVTVSIPDHNHAVATAMALHAGKHVYCQKPLTHSVAEARYITHLAAKTKLATQMGTQGHAFPSYTRLVELIESGAIGSVTQVHVWTDRPSGWWPQPVTAPTGNTAPPSTLDWNQWLGPAQERSYNKAYLPFIWRGWWDFGTGALGDMACHLMDPVFWSLKLSYPTSVEATSEGATKDGPPTWAVINYDFPKRGKLPPVRVTWYDGKKRYPEALLNGEKVPPIDNGSLFIGDKGALIVNHGSDPILLPTAKFADFKGPTPYLKRSPGHHLEWIEACKNGSPTGSNFGYAGPMTEAILLGNVAIRVGRKINYDSRNMHAVGDPEADALLRPAYRPGWNLP